ncbi:MAG: hypothetical protein AAFV93_18720 [Chloroflexota bacterium]
MQTGELIQRSTSDIFAIQQFFGTQAIGIGRTALDEFTRLHLIMISETKMLEMVKHIIS